MTGLRKLVQNELNPDKTQKQAKQISSKEQYHTGTLTDYHIGVLEPETNPELEEPMAYMLVTGDGTQRPKTDKIAVFLASINENKDGEYSLKEPTNVNEAAILPQLSATEFEYAEQLQDYFDIPEYQQGIIEN